MRAPGTLALLACLALTLPVGCGSSQPGGRATTAQPADATIRIQAPADGARVKATRGKSGRLRAPLRVRGQARPGSSVFLTASCRPRPCRQRARTGPDGRWAATLKLQAPSSARFVTLDANAQRDVVAAGSAVVTVELIGPARSGPKRETTSTRSSSAEREPSAAQATTGPRARRTLPHEVLVIGDSLATGMAAPLQAELAGWGVRTDARIGRPLAEGLRILGEQSARPAIIAFSLFTNDDPRNARALEQAVRSTAGGTGCVVWSTVARPPVDGTSYDAANVLLRGLASDPELADGLRVVDWAAEVAQSPSLVARDRVHGTPAGYRVLGRLYAEAIRSCAGAA